MEKRKTICSVCEEMKDENNRFCEKCKKETSNVVSIIVEDEAVCKEFFGIKQKIMGIKGWAIKASQGFRSSYDKIKFPNGVDLHRRIDRKNNQYDEVIKDEKTGKIINESHEPLSEHVGHGSARNK